MTAAILDIAEAYADRDRRRVPVDVASTHQDVHGPAWLIPVAIVQSDPQTRIADTLELALAAGIDSSSLQACVTYVEIAAAVFAGDPPTQAIRAETGPGDVGHGRLQLSGHTCTDAVAASVWALARESTWCHARCGDVEALLNQVATAATPGVVAAAAGHLGLHAGAGAWPLQRQKRPGAAALHDLARGLLRARRPLLAEPPTRAVAV